MLYIISTPIGNLEDITFRAVETLKTCDYVLCEDTRRTSKIFLNYNIHKPLISFNEFSEKRKTGEVIEDLKSGKNIALVSDSGTPCVSDPGFFLVRECTKYDLMVSPVPGASAAISALICSGLPTDRFVFYGFLPKNNSKRRKIFEEINMSDKTSIFYESPYRIIKTFSEISILMPDRQAVIAREMTKKFEEFIRGSAIDVYEKIKNKTIKGEIAVVLS